MNPLDQPGPRWFTIPAHRPFLDDLAAGLIDALPGPEDTPGALLLVPTRRGVRALAESFLKAGTGRAVLLPQIRAVGDLDEGEPPFEPGDAALDLPPAIDPLRRRFELASLAARFDDQDRSAQHALSLADALAGLIDAAAIEEAPVLERLDGLVDLDLAEHWEKSAKLLEKALVAWPDRLRELGLMDVAERRVKLLDRLAEQWTNHPPQGPVIAAGSTGSAPATARLLTVVAGLPRGAVVLPGLDQELADSAWAGIEDQHPQDSMRRLLQTARIDRGQVREWRPRIDLAGRWRRRLVNEALRPADATADWLGVIAKLREEAEPGLDPFAAGLDGLTDITASSEDEAATVCALLLREALETEGQTAALVTPDQALARRVSARLARWGVNADSTAGTPLTRFAPGMLAQAVAGLVADPADPVARLAVLKNPLVRLNRTPEDLAAAREGLERWGLRGPRPRTPQALERRLTEAERKYSTGDLGPALALSRDLDAAIDLAVIPFAPQAPAHRAAEALTQALEKLCEGEGLLWAGPEGECLSRLLTGVIAHGEALPPVDAPGWLSLVQTLLNEETVRGAEAAHPRLHILGVLESRMIRADRLILAGLEEGVWPRGAAIDPFLSRPMRKTLGLPSPERRIGQSAHDFAQAACAPDVTLVSSARREGAPAAPSRWLWRLRTLAQGAQYRLPSRPELLDWAKALDQPGDYGPVRRPQPNPPVEDRPRLFSVTRIETLTRDPYAVWARDILKFFPLDRPDRMVEAMARGTAIHSAFEALGRRWNEGEPPAPEAMFETLYLEALAEEGLSEAALARERALAREAARWVAGFERRRRADGAKVHVEISGELVLQVDGVPHRLTAKADRIEVTRDHKGHVLDYKTGSIPTKKMVDAGFSPQLTLTAAILRDGGFDGITATHGSVSPGDLTYVRVTGRIPAGSEEVSKAAGPDSEAAAAAALEGIRDLLRSYLSPDQTYPSRTAPQFVKAYAGDYDHLARVFEWSTGGDGEEGGE
ncbi:ATP-dependent helicase/nuclease subunit B [Caulobacter ginsengisoli]|uniref:ATP-dependent helicase/nuclease subunit B n=1 Tax=Caulobacter ginsengisoli TaxID=400775 RepID=A0ABU0IXW0_9CAUL|nr:double-strand break repair protein AddB [Caulobacter ginsengisoli]MDQ0466848.1 ATP-dependent helicase/nuclease subunit B [Caulobacter ginsengisoli]